MPTIEREIVINRPIEEVFDFVADGRNEPHYNPDSLHTEQTWGEGIGSGTRFRSEGKMMGRRLEVVYEVGTYERPTQLSLHLIKPPPGMDLRGVQTFEVVAGGTRTRWSYELEPRGIFKLMTPLITRMFDQRIQQMLTNLKRLLESHERPSTPE